MSEPTQTENSPPEGTLDEELHRLLQAVELAGKAILPNSNDELLQSIVNAAARIFGAKAAALLLVDEDEESLIFRVEFGNKEQNLVGVKIPLDKGIAGYVVMTGQAIAVSNVQQDARFNLDFARSTGYVPDSILAAPLLLGDRVIGVLEVLDKIKASSFGMQDMELMGLFAEQAALAIRQSQQLDRIGDAVTRGLRRLAEGEGLPDSGPFIQTLETARRSSAETEDLFALAGLFNHISQLGSAERLAAMKVLATFAEYSRAKSKTRGRFI